MNRLPLFAIALALPILALGGVTEEGVIVAAIGTALVGAVAAYASGVVLRRESRLVLLGFCGASSWELLQLVPLPSGLLRFIAPNNARIWADNDAVFGRTVGWHPVSLDPHATAFMVVTTLVVASFFCIAATYAHRSSGRVRLVRAIIIAIFVFDVVAIAHPLLSISKLYGVFDVPSSTRVLFAPLLNANHAAALAAVAPPLLIGWGLESKDFATATTAFVGSIAASAVAVLFVSRGGMAVLALELVAMTAYALLRRGTGKRRLAVVSAASIGAAAIVAVPIYVAVEPLSREASNHDLTKLSVVTRAATMISDFGWLGVGRGAFTSTFAAYEGSLNGMLRFTHVENWPLQLAIDLGVPVAAAFAAVLGIAVARSVRGSLGRPLTFGALVALLGLGVHDLGDFSMEFAGVALIAVALLAVVTGSSRTQETKGSRLLALAPVVLACAAPGLLVRHWHHDVDEDARSIARSWSAGELNELVVTAAADRHPAEPYFPMVEGVVHLRTADAAPYFLRAIKLGPSRPAAHFWLARWFLGANRRGQAWAEYREALRLSPAFRGPVLDDMIAVDAPLDDIIAIAPDEPSLDEASYRLQAKGRETDAAALDDLIIERYPSSIEPRVRRIDREVRKGDFAGAQLDADALLKLAPNDPNAWIAASKVSLNDLDDEAVLGQGLSQLGDVPELLEELIRRRGKRLGADSVRGEIERLRVALVTRDGHGDHALALKGEIELQTGHSAAAIAAYLDAAAASPDGDAYLETAASIAETTGQLALAESLYARLSASQPQEPRFREALSRVRKRIAELPPDLSLPTAH